MSETSETTKLRSEEIIKCNIAIQWNVTHVLQRNGSSFMYQFIPKCPHNIPQTLLLPTKVTG